MSTLSQFDESLPGASQSGQLRVSMLDVLISDDMDVMAMHAEAVAWRNMAQKARTEVGHLEFQLHVQAAEHLQKVRIVERERDTFRVALNDLQNNALLVKMA